MTKLRFVAKLELRFLSDVDEVYAERGKTVKKISDVLYNSSGKSGWKFFYQSINVLYNNFAGRLRDLYPDLDEKDILVCCLSKTGFNDKEIGLLTKDNQNIIQKRKSIIREKTGMRKRESFVKQLDEIVEPSQKILPKQKTN